MKFLFTFLVGAPEEWRVYLVGRGKPGGVLGWVRG